MKNKMSKSSRKIVGVALATFLLTSSIGCKPNYAQELDSKPVVTEKEQVSIKNTYKANSIYIRGKEFPIIYGKPLQTNQELVNNADNAWVNIPLVKDGGYGKDLSDNTVKTYHARNILGGDIIKGLLTGDTVTVTDASGKPKDYIITDVKRFVPFENHEILVDLLKYTDGDSLILKTAEYTPLNELAFDRVVIAKPLDDDFSLDNYNEAINLEQPEKANSLYMKGKRFDISYGKPLQANQHLVDNADNAWVNVPLVKDGGYGKDLSQDVIKPYYARVDKEGNIIKELSLGDVITVTDDNIKAKDYKVTNIERFVSKSENSNITDLSKFTSGDSLVFVTTETLPLTKEDYDIVVVAKPINNLLENQIKKDKHYKSDSIYMKNQRFNIVYGKPLEANQFLLDASINAWVNIPLVKDGGYGKDLLDNTMKAYFTRVNKGGDFIHRLSLGEIITVTDNHGQPKHYVVDKIERFVPKQDILMLKDLSKLYNGDSLLFTTREYSSSFLYENYSRIVIAKPA